MNKILLYGILIIALLLGWSEWGEAGMLDQWKPEPESEYEC